MSRRGTGSIRSDPHDAVIADYLVSAPLSSRRRLYSYYDESEPARFRTQGLIPESAGCSFETTTDLKLLLDQGFEVVHQGKNLTIAHRLTDDLENEIPIFSEFLQHKMAIRCL